MSRISILLIIALGLISGCAGGAGSAHRNFMDVIHSDVGMSIDYPYISLNRYPESRGKISQLSNGNKEYQYLWDSRQGKECTVYYEVDKASERIVAVRFEGTPDTCYLVP